jgi:UDP-2-acetamido-3-amino-2,3-dideoxy-glucuronate N-acetyltransferase
MAGELNSKYFVHQSSYIDDGVSIGAGTRIWHFCHILEGSVIGDNCIIGQNVMIGPDTTVGNFCKIQNNVSVYNGVKLEDYVFCGPSMVFTNIANPRCEFPQRGSIHNLPTLVRYGASIGANATIVCGITIGRFSFIGAGAVVASNVPDYALMLGVPAVRKGWMSRHGHRLPDPDRDGLMVCPKSGWRYREQEPGVLRCLDCSEENVAPAEPSRMTEGQTG